MTATIKKLHQGLDNVDFIGTENINGSLRLAVLYLYPGAFDTLYAWVTEGRLPQIL